MRDQVLGDELQSKSVLRFPCMKQTRAKMARHLLPPRTRGICESWSGRAFALFDNSLWLYLIQVVAEVTDVKGKTH